MMRFNKGFTLIEMMLSMTFVSMLLIAIALLSIQISNTYTRGVTLRQVNVAGQELGSDVQRTVQAAQSMEVDNDYIVFMKGSVDRVKKGQDAYSATINGPTDVMGGRLCLQDQSYVWNTGSYLNGDPDGDNPNGSVRLVRAESDMCTYTDDGTALSHYTNVDDAGIVSEELLRTGDRDLAVHKLLVHGDAAKGLYSISFTIGTNREGTLETSSDRCKAPDSAQSDLDYCSVNRFDIVARTIPDKSSEED